MLYLFDIIDKQEYNTANEHNYTIILWHNFL